MRRILCVEDDPGFAGVMAEFHAKADRIFVGEAELMVVGLLHTAKHVISSDLSGGISMVLLDLALPDSKPEATIDWVAENRSTLPPIFVITGDGSLATRQRCLAMGAVGFWEKHHIVAASNAFFAAVYNEWYKSLLYGNRRQ